MRPDILIIGQGLAGTLLAWEFERAGIAFAIADHGHATAATLAAAGIINPITGRRLVKSWHVEALLTAARVAYRELEAALGVPLWREMRVRRLFMDDRERAVFAGKQARGDLAPFVESGDDAGFWICPAARVDLRVLLAAARERWTKAGSFAASSDSESYDLVVDCTGTAVTRWPEFGFIPWEFSKGEILEIALDGLAPDVVLNRRHWIVPVGDGIAWVGATHEPGVRDLQASLLARQTLEASACELLGVHPFAITGQRAGVRVNLPDKRPIVGRHPGMTRLGLINGLGAKGALWAPLLARQWVNHLTEGVPFDAEIDVRRYGRDAAR